MSESHIQKQWSTHTRYQHRCFQRYKIYGISSFQRTDLVHSHYTVSRLKKNSSTVLSDIMKTKDNHTQFEDDMSILKFCNRILLRLREFSGIRNHMSKTAVTILKKHGNNLHCNLSAMQNICGEAPYRNDEALFAPYKTSLRFSDHANAREEGFKNHSVRHYSRYYLRNRIISANRSEGNVKLSIFFSLLFVYTYLA